MASPVADHCHRADNQSLAQVWAIVAGGNLAQWLQSALP